MNEEDYTSIDKYKKKVYQNNNPIKKKNKFDSVIKSMVCGIAIGVIATSAYSIEYYCTAIRIRMEQEQKGNNAAMVLAKNINNSIHSGLEKIILAGNKRAALIWIDILNDLLYKEQKNFQKNHLKPDSTSYDLMMET